MAVSINFHEYSSAVSLKQTELFSQDDSRLHVISHAEVVLLYSQQSADGRGIKLLVTLNFHTVNFHALLWGS